MNKQFKIQSGITIIELMVAMVIGLVLIGGAIQLLGSNKMTYRIENALSELQENGRYIVENMAKDIRMAGYNGCSSRSFPDIKTVANNPPPYDADEANSILGFEGDAGGNWTPALDPSITNPVANTDVITVQGADECGALVDDNKYGPDDINIQVFAPNGCGFEQNDVVLFTDCGNAVLYQISNAPGGIAPTEVIGNGAGTNTNAVGTAEEWKRELEKDAHIYKFRNYSYFISPDPNTNDPALWKASWDPTAVGNFNTFELAQGVEDMQILYGIDTDITGGTNSYIEDYLSADNVADWTAVRSVRINLLLASGDNTTSEPRAIMFNGLMVNNPNDAGADRKLRMVYSATVTLRNRLP